MSHVTVNKRRRSAGISSNPYGHIGQMRFKTKTTPAVQAIAACFLLVWRRY
jgi:hypothetical protein